MTTQTESTSITAKTLNWIKQQIGLKATKSSLFSNNGEDSKLRADIYPNRINMDVGGIRSEPSGAYTEMVIHSDTAEAVGALLTLRPTNSASLPGAFALVTRNPDDSVGPNLVGTPSGELTWGGVEVLKRSHYLNGVNISLGTGTAWNVGGASLHLSPASEDAGHFVLTAANDSVSYSLSGNTYGELIWKSNPVLHEGFYQGSPGNGRSVTFGAGYDFNRGGASMSLFPANHPDMAGCFSLRATNEDGTNVRELYGNLNGMIYYDGDTLNQYIDPAWAYQAPCDGTTFTVPYSGLAIIKAQRFGSGGGHMEVTISGTQIVSVESNNYSIGFLCIPLRAGQTLKLNPNGINSYYCYVYVFNRS